MKNENELMRGERKIARKKPGNKFIDEEREWLNLSPSQRMLETTKLWQLYLALGGSLDPEPNPQSPFYFQKAQS
ncbi:MAG: hypothetical protein ABIH69_03725 [bacterium]